MSQMIKELPKVVGKTTATAVDDEPAEGPFDSLPDEMVVLVLSFADLDALLKCRLVCKQWQQLVDKYAFQEKASRENRQVMNGVRGYRSFSAIDATIVRKLDLPWYVFYAICKYDPFNTNLVKNNCGQNRFEHWSMNEDQKWWTIEGVPEGAPSLPNHADFNGYTSCFVSSYRKCSKEQTINLKVYGLNEIIMSSLRPEIVISDWYSGRFDSGCKYELRAMLFNKNERLLEQHNYTDILAQWEANKWTRVSHFFRSQSKTSHITISHSGVDTQFWAGFYGTKIAGTAVKVLLPINLKNN